MLARDYRRFYSECSITALVSEEGYLSTDCVTSAGTSGSVIVAKADGAILSLVAWGRNRYETNGPLLANFQDHLGGEIRNSR